MDVVEFVDVGTDELDTVGRRDRRVHHPREARTWPALTWLAASVLAVAAPFTALFRSVTAWTTPGTPLRAGRAVTEFSFDGWGRALTARSIDSIGFPFAGHGPSFGTVTLACGAALLVATVLSVRAGSRWRGLGAQLAFAAGAALLAAAGSMWLTVQPGVVTTVTGMSTVTTVGPCAWLTAAAGAMTVLVTAGTAVLAARSAPATDPAAPPVEPAGR